MKLLETIGKTNLVQLENISKNIYVKVEKSNPAGSIKDRAAYQMIMGAIERGELKEGMKIVEPTSGNTGIGLALIGRTLGFPVVLTMPSSMSIERVKLIKAYGAEVILIKEGGMAGSVEKAKELVENGAYYMPNQFDNQDNALAHYKTTGPEIYNDLKDINGFVAGFGTGGTVTGVGKYLKEQDKNIKIWAMEPYESPLLSQGKSGSHKIQGIGANFIPKVLDVDLLDEVITVKSDDAIDMARRLSKEEGLLVGISSGANVVAALKMQEKLGGNIVTVLPDTGERYLSTELFND
ncbi:MAG: cysteine synthase A [Peptoniphilus lacrimalis]